MGSSIILRAQTYLQKPIDSECPGQRNCSPAFARLSRIGQSTLKKPVLAQANQMNLPETSYFCEFWETFLNSAVGRRLCSIVDRKAWVRHRVHAKREEWLRISGKRHQ